MGFGGNVSTMVYLKKSFPRFAADAQCFGPVVQTIDDSRTLLPVPNILSSW
jgi:hypothetical protein